MSVQTAITPTLATPEANAALLAEAAAVTAQGDNPALKPPVSPNTGHFTADDIERARREEKDKLYSRIEKMDEELKVYRTEREVAMADARAKADAVEAERKAREEAEMSAKDFMKMKEDEFQKTLNHVQEEWEEKFNRLQAESEARKAALEKEREFQELQSYKQRRLTEEAENLMPELLDLVKWGNTPEEIDAAIQLVAEKTSAIMSNVQPLLTQAQQRPRGISATGATPVGPLENSTEQQTLSVDDIKSMSMDQWASIRDRVVKTK